MSGPSGYSFELEYSEEELRRMEELGFILKLGTQIQFRRKDLQTSRKLVQLFYPWNVVHPELIVE